MNKLEEHTSGEASLFGVDLELTRVLSAAIINPEFCKLLLNDPKKALEQGFQGEKFLLPEEKRNFFLSIRADTLQDLAKTILAFKPPQKPLIR